MKTWTLALGLIFSTAGCGGVQGISLDPGAPDMAPSHAPDLLTGNHGYDMKSVPTGFAFGFANDLPVGLQLSTVRVADLNGDGKLDAVALGSTPIDSGTAQVGTTVLVALGNGDGTFATPKTLTSPNSFGDFALVDVNDDHRIDLVASDLDVPGSGQGAAAATGASVEVRLGNGDGTFGAPALFGTYPSGGPITLAMGDYNNDGNVDIAVADFGTDTDTSKVSVLLGNGNGTFGTAKYLAVGGYSLAMVSGDFNGDGKLDLVRRSTSAANTSVSLYLGNGDGTFVEHIIPATNGATGSMVALVTAFDANGDGKPDLLVDDSSGSQLLLNDGKGNFTAASVIPAGSESAAATGDLDGDGRIDVAFADGEASLSFNLNLASGWSSSKVLSLNATTYDLALGDLNGDGALDFIVTDGSNLTTILHQ